MVARGDKADHTRYSDGARHVRSRRARFAARIKKCACCDIASHAPRLMAVCNECLRAWPVPAELHLELEKEARIAFFANRESAVAIGPFRGLQTTSNGYW